MRSAVMRSPSSGQARKTTASGATKLTATASATPTDRTAEKKNSVDSIMLTELANCRPMRRVRKRSSPRRGVNTAATSTTWTTTRNHTASTGG